MKRIALIALTVLAAVSIGCGQSGKTAVKTATNANSLSFAVNDVNDRAIDMRQHLGKVVIVDFWDTWCPPCKKEIPHFIELYSQYKGQGLEIVGVAFGRNGKEAVRQFTQQSGMNYTSALFNEEAQKIFGAPQSIPTTYIIDKKGNIVEKVVGYRDKSYFEEKVKALLKS